MQEEPAWLSELENKREKLKQTVLSHDIGSGAPCKGCDKCPGLDLHYWRKICRACKCRRDKHICNYGSEILAAQFNFLGGIQCKPVFINIQQLSNNPIQIEWAPANVTTEMYTDYLKELGEEKIPIVGSNAAFERQQQLQFQIPPHDLDSLLCDNLSEEEKRQLKQYVENLRTNFAGQGSILRMKHNNQKFSFLSQAEWQNLLTFVKMLLKNETVLETFSNNNQIVNTLKINRCQNSPSPKNIEAQQPIQGNVLNNLTSISANTKLQLRSLRNEDIISLHYNGSTHDQILEAVQKNNLDCIKDPRLAAIEIFRKEYVNNSNFKQDVKQFFEKVKNSCENEETTKETKENELTQQFTDLSFNDFENNYNEICCHECKLPIYFGGIAVKAERAGNRIWHPQCFKCSICKNLLVDLVYFCNEGELFCGRDLAQKLKIPRCKACDELIFTKQFTSAENANFHIKHFCCFHCDTPLAGKNYIAHESENIPICLPCHESFYAHKCQTCKRVIKANDKGVTLGEIHWHDCCFYYVNCKKSLLGDRFCIKYNAPFCSNACIRNN